LEAFHKTQMLRSTSECGKGLVEFCHKAMRDSKEAVGRCLKAYREVLRTKFAVDDMKSVIDHLSKNDDHWKTLEGISKLMGKVYEEDDAEEKKECSKSPDELVDESKDCTFFEGLVEKKAYAFFLVFPKVNLKKYGPTLRTTMTAVPVEILTFFLELYHICTSFEDSGLVKDLLPNCLNPSVMNFDDIVQPHTEISLSCKARHHALLGETLKNISFRGRHFHDSLNLMSEIYLGAAISAGTEDLAGKTIYNVQGSSKDKPGSQYAGWIGWYTEHVGNNNAPFLSLPTVAARCRIEKQLPYVAPALGTQWANGVHNDPNSTDPAKIKTYIIGGHMKLYGDPTNTQMILPICKTHNARSIYDGPGYLLAKNSNCLAVKIQ